MEDDCSISECSFIIDSKDLSWRDTQGLIMSEKRTPFRFFISLGAFLWSINDDDHPDDEYVSKKELGPGERGAPFQDRKSGARKLVDDGLDAAWSPGRGQRTHAAVQGMPQGRSEVLQSVF